MRSFGSVALLFISCLAVVGSCFAVEAPAAAGTALTSVSAVLKSDGSLDLSKGIAGSFDVTGYRMVTDASGAPRFVPAATGEPTDVQVPAVVAETSETVWALAVDGLGNVYRGGDLPGGGAGGGGISGAGMARPGICWAVAWTIESMLLR